MINKPLIAGIVGFMLGGLLVSVAATTFDKPEQTQGQSDMAQMTESLRGKNGDAYDKLFIAHMIEHHQAAIDMAKLSETRARHEEIKVLSRAIISAQQQEITEMKQWQSGWGYNSPSSSTRSHSGH